MTDIANISRATARRARRGITLLEIIIVIALVATLAAFAIPQFSRARKNTTNEVARTNAETALKTAVIALDDGDPSTAMDDDLAEAGLKAPATNTDPSTAKDMVSWKYASGDITIAVRGDGTTCYEARASKTAGEGVTDIPSATCQAD